MPDFIHGALAVVAFLAWTALPVGFLALVAYSIHVTGLAHIGRLLEQQGFRVRDMKRSWLNTEIPGTRRSDWLVRVVVEDREGRLRSGWVRLPGLRLRDTADRWTVVWDERPSG